MLPSTVSIIGAGLAGCEAALQLANYGKKVVLYDQKPVHYLAPYCMHTFAELVCNNSLGNRSDDKPLGLLVSELKTLGSELISFAEESSVQDSHYYSINKRVFSDLVTSAITHNNNITVCNQECEHLPSSEVVIIASGPTTNERLLEDISSQCGMPEYHFSDSSCAIIDINSIDLSNPNIRKESDDLYSVIIPRDIFSLFSQTLTGCSKKTEHNGENSSFLLSHSIEALAAKGEQELLAARFSHDGFPDRCLLLRREGALENGFILVGCMTSLYHKDQKKVFSLLPGFSKVSIIKYGRMHQNTFFNSPGYLNSFYKVKNQNIYVIGQLSGIDGYAPAISSGFVAAQSVLFGNALPVFPRESMIGGLAYYVSNEQVQDYQPMCASFSLIPGEQNTQKSLFAIRAIQNYAVLLDELREGLRNTTDV